LAGSRVYSSVNEYPARLQKLLRDIECLPPARQAEAKLALIGCMLHMMSREELVAMWVDVVQLFGPDEGFADLIEGHLALRELVPSLTH
jgi:hypothetical protein